VSGHALHVEGRIEAGLIDVSRQSPGTTAQFPLHVTRRQADCRTPRQGTYDELEEGALLRVIRDERWTSLKAKPACRPMSVSATLTLAPGCPPRRLLWALSARRCSHGWWRQVRLYGGDTEPVSSSPHDTLTYEDGVASAAWPNGPTHSSGSRYTSSACGRPNSCLTCAYKVISES
jgi:hypothetical protein